MNFYKYLLASLVVFFGVLGLPKISWAATYYVDNSCPSNGNGTSQACGSQGPFNSLANAQAAVIGNKSDSSLLFKKGQTFSGPFTVGAYGTAGHPFLISSYGTGERPIINGGSSNIGVQSKNYVTINGLHFTNAVGDWGAGIYVNMSNNITITDCEIDGMYFAGIDGAHGIMIFNSSNVIVDNNIIHKGDYAGIIVYKNSSTYPTTGITISNNKIYNVAGDGIMIDGPVATRIDGSTSNIYGNEIYNTSAGIYLSFGNNFKVYQNNFHDNGRPNATLLSGTISVVNGSPNVVGSGTHFSTELAVETASNAWTEPGHVSLVQSWGSSYKISSITDDTHLTLTTNYSGLNKSGAAIYRQGPGEDYGIAVRSASYNEFYDNQVSRSVNTGIGIFGDIGAGCYGQSQGETCAGPSDGNKVYRNIVSETVLDVWARDINWQCYVNESVGINNEIFYNIFWGTVPSLINFVVGDNITSGNKAYNNVFYGGSQGVSFGNSVASGWEFKNNIFAGHSAYNFDANAAQSNIIFSNNLYYKSGGGTLVRYNGSNYTSSNITSIDANAKTADPRFVGTSAWSDFRLQAGSPAIDAGANLGTSYQNSLDPNDLTWPPSTLNQNSNGSGWEIGAFAYVGAAPDTTPPNAPMGVTIS